MGITRAALLKTVRANGYTGEENAEAVKKWVAENLDLTDGDGAPVNVDEAWANVPAKKAAKVEPEAKTGAKMDEKFGRAHLSGEAEAKGMNAGALERSWARKAYDRKAAQGQTRFDNADVAEAFAAWARSLANFDYSQRSRDEDIVKGFFGSEAKTWSSSSNNVGGAFVPDVFLPSLINVRNQFGAAFRAVGGGVPMSSGEATYPRLAAAMSVAWSGQNTAASVSAPSTNNVKLIANKLIGLSLMSNEVFNDSAINVADTVATEFGRDAGRAVDQAALFGAGEATNGGFQGIATAINGLSATKTDISSYQVGSGATFPSITLTDLLNTIGRVMPGALGQGAAWIWHPAAYFAVAERIAKSAGGTTVGDIRGGSIPPDGVNSGFSLLGYPVLWSPVMPGVAPSSGNKIIALFGNFGMGMKIGRVNGSDSVEVSRDRYFDSDQTALRLTSRVAIACHDFGTGTNTEAARLANPTPIAALAVA